MNIYMYSFLSVFIGASVGYGICFFKNKPVKDELKHLQDIMENSHVIPDDEMKEFKRVREWAYHVADTLKKLRARVDELERLVSELSHTTRSVSDRLEKQRGKLRSAIDTVKEYSGVVSKAMDGINTISSELETAASDLAASTEKLSYTISDIEQSTVSAEKGLVDVEKSMKSEMEHVREDRTRLRHLEEATAKIGGIVDEIEKIARQTKLLSLNASIEAARAGESGKGFAVVALEIGKLADESAKSAEDVRNTVSSLISLIQVAYDQSQQRVIDMEGFSELIRVSNEKMRNIMDAIEHIDMMGSDLAAVSEELAATTAQVSDSIEDVSVSMESLSRAITYMADMERHLADIKQDIDAMMRSIVEM